MMMITNYNINGLHHKFSPRVEYSICSAVCRVSQKNALITLGVHLSPLITICQNITFATKHMEIFHSGFSSLPYFMQGGGCSLPQGDLVVYIAGCIHSFSPK